MEKLIFVTVMCFFLLSFVMHKERVYKPEFETSIPSVGKQIAEARIERGYTQAEFSTKIQVNLRTLQNIEHDKAVPVYGLLSKIQKVLDCKIVIDGPIGPADLAMKH
jgi:DNA-binding XRE family transcriptional regulator